MTATVEHDIAAIACWHRVLSISLGFTCDPTASEEVRCILQMLRRDKPKLQDEEGKEPLTGKEVVVFCSRPITSRRQAHAVLVVMVCFMLILRNVAARHIIWHRNLSRSHVFLRGRGGNADDVSKFKTQRVGEVVMRVAVERFGPGGSCF